MKRLIISLAVALMLTAVMAVPAMAADTADTTVSGTVSAVLEVTAPATITFAALNVGPNTYTGTSPADDVKIQCNDPDGWDLKVKSNKTDGKMQNAGATRTLGAELLVTVGDLANAIILDTPEQVVKSDTAPGEWSGTISLSQVIALTDAADTYSLILTFTGYTKP